MTTVEIHASPGDLARAAAALFTERASGAVSARGRFTAALSGGRTPEAFYSLLAKAPFTTGIPWDRVHLFWGDERCVPPEHGESNYRLARERFSTRAHPPANIHRIRGEMDPVEAAALYEGVLRDSSGSTGNPSPPLTSSFSDLGKTDTRPPSSRNGPIRETARWVAGTTWMPGRGGGSP
jgi:6-phosphogluconolactonase